MAVVLAACIQITAVHPHVARHWIAAKPRRLAMRLTCATAVRRCVLYIPGAVLPAHSTAPHVCMGLWMAVYGATRKLHALAPEPHSERIGFWKR